MQVIRDITPLVLGRPLKLCNFLDYQDIKVCLAQFAASWSHSLASVTTWTSVSGLKPDALICSPLKLPRLRWNQVNKQPSAQVVYKRYASLYFVMGIEPSDNELINLEIVHHFVEVLDRYFGNVCELDLIFNFHKVSLPPVRGHM